MPERARRRTFTATYKLEFLAAYEAAAEGEALADSGEILMFDSEDALTAAQSYIYRYNMTSYVRSRCESTT